MWWNVYIALHSKFPVESVSEIIFKIGEDLTKLLPKVWWLPFSGQCIFARPQHQLHHRRFKSYSLMIRLSLSYDRPNNRLVSAKNEVAPSRAKGAITSKIKHAIKHTIKLKT